MDDLSWIAPTVGSLCAMVVAIIAANRSKDAAKVSKHNGQKMDGVTAKVETVLEKASEIHGATNGTLHAAEAATAAAISLGSVLTAKVEGLEKQLAALKLSGTLAADAAAQAATDVRAATAAMPPEVGVDAG